MIDCSRAINHVAVTHSVMWMESHRRWLQATVYSEIICFKNPNIYFILTWKILEIPMCQQWFFLGNGISGSFILFLLLVVFSNFYNEHIILL